MLHHSRLDPSSGIYVEQFSCVLRGAMDIERFRAAWQTVVLRHDVLKTLFIRLHEARPMQVVRQRATLPLEVRDWRTLASEEHASRFEALLADDRRRGIAFDVAPLMRVTVVTLADDRHRFLWTYHHAILDGWSMPVLLGEVFASYARPELPLPAAARDYRHYVQWLAAQDTQAANAFWRDMLAGYREPLRFAPSVEPSVAAASAERRLRSVEAALPADWLQTAQQRCRAEHITLSTLCQGAWMLLLARLGGVDDVVSGVVMSGRQSTFEGAERIAGLFINTLPVRVRLDGESRVGDWLRGVQRLTREVEQNASCALTEALQCSDVPRHLPLFDALYVFENYPGRDAFDRLAADCGWRVEATRAVEETNYALALIVLPADALHLQLTYDTARFDARFVDRLLGHYRALLECMIADPMPRLGALALAAPEWRRIRPEAAAPAPIALVDALLARATHAPEQLALSYAHQQGTAEGGLTIAVTIAYAALAERVTRAIRQWKRFGLQAGDRVILIEPEPITRLVLLYSGLACGIDCWMAEDSQSAAALAELRREGAGWPTLRGCASASSAVSGMLCFVFDERHPDYGKPAPAADQRATDPMPAAQGACSLFTCDADGTWQQVRYRHHQLALAAQSFAESFSAGECVDVAIDGPLDAPTHLAIVLGALHAGLSIHQVAGSDAGSVLQRLADSARRWHSVFLGAPATRRLEPMLERAPHARIECAYLVADSRSLTPHGARAMGILAPRARHYRVLRWPAVSLPHALDPIDAGTTALAALIHPLGPDATVGVVDTHGNPAGTDALGRLALGGASVPESIRTGAAFDGTAGPGPSRDAPLPTTLEAWRTAAGCELRLPDPRAAADAPAADWAALEVLAARAADADAHALAVVERLDANARWETILFHVGAQAACDVLLAACEGDPERRASIDAVIELAAMPRDAHGRIDRACLIAGAATPVRPSSSGEPASPIEAGILEIWQALLQRQDIGLHDDYFELGGDSLQATVMLYQIEAQFGKKIGTQALLAKPTIAALAARVASEADDADDAMPDLRADAVLDPAITPNAVPTAAAARAVLLTGATGFLGVHLLEALLNDTAADVWCLVRANDAQAGARRLRDAMQAHGVWREAYAARIRAVPGDLALRNLGLSDADFDALARSVDVIYHNGALVNFVYSYAALKPANVDATEAILRLASLHGAIPVHYVSTVGTLNRHADAIPETLAVPYHDYLATGYEQSKWVAEQLVAQASARGLPVTVYRPSRIVGHSSSGRMNLDDLFSRLIKGIALQGQAPRNVGFDNMLPVDVVSRIIVASSLSAESAGKAVHVVNPVWNSLDALVDYIEQAGYPLTRLDYDQWLAALDDHVRVMPEHPLATLIPVLTKLNPSADPSIGKILPIESVQLHRLAGAVLADSLRPAEVWLDTFFDYFHAEGFLPAVADAVDGA
ncbi:thioester reductase domain-containing protein [Burkholderia sp. Ac-20379]|uniref:thioester reductase domain-containing protein n=1 Tax=Burkholderia sp. Ac-20379 TaxID=2703900 RepID=UPI001F11E9A5|nr:thioester reductase domain-containing protein [Burkholderia sp. Ac-20379]